MTKDDMQKEPEFTGNKRWKTLDDVSVDIRRSVDVLELGSFVPMSKSSALCIADLIDSATAMLSTCARKIDDERRAHRLRAEQNAADGNSLYDDQETEAADACQRIAREIFCMLGMTYFVDCVAVGNGDEAYQIEPSRESEGPSNPGRTPPTSEDGIHDNPIIAAVVREINSDNSRICGALVGQRFNRTCYR